ncbi:MAG: hypothetical protein M3Q23_17425 [Actinomycetota bacterium]|nr:hypothetical protein [Actinomycetota bacterium]
MGAVDAAAEGLRSLAAELEHVVSQGADRAEAWLTSPAGRRFRKNAARAVLIGTPLLFRHRFFRYTWTGRLIELAGGAALLIKLAEAIRDWEPELSPGSSAEPAAGPAYS